MNNLTRAITGDGSAFVVAVVTTNALRDMENLLKPSAVVSAALGRLLTASALMASQLKGKNDRLTLILKLEWPHLPPEQQYYRKNST